MLSEDKGLQKDGMKEKIKNERTNNEIKKK